MFRGSNENAEPRSDSDYPILIAFTDASPSYRILKYWERERVDRSLFQSRGGAGLLVDRRRASFQEDDDEGYGVRRAAFLAGLRDLLCSLHHIPPFPVCRRHLLWRGRLLRSPRVISLFLISRCICCH